MSGFNGSTGVPTKQMEDAIAQSTAITTGTATRNTTYTLASNLRYSVFSKIVVVHGWVKLSSDAMSAGGHEIASGLPPCVAPMDTAALFAYDQTSKKMVCLVIRTTGKIETDNTTLDTSANGNVINFNATYIAQ